MRAILVLIVASAPIWAQLQEFKPSRWNLFSQQQDIEMGKQAAADVRKTMQVVDDPVMTAYVQRVGDRLLTSPRTKAFPFTFTVVNDPSINAFALPGGPMFVNTGLLAALDNESQLAGVLAHEMSHVTLRHGSSNMSKANLIELPAMLGGSALTSKGGLWGMVGPLVGGLGAQSVVLKFSRDAEKQADLNGAQIMNDAGYDPNEMAKFFQKLEEQGKHDDGRLANFMSDHPTPGKRVEYVAAQNKYLPTKSYVESAGAGELPQVKTLVASLPAPPKPAPTQAAAVAAPASNGSSGSASRTPTGVAAEARPSGQYKTFQGRDFTLSYPDNWELFGEQNGPTATMAPRAAIVADKEGHTQVAYGYLVASYYSQDKKPSLSRDTADLVKQLVAGDQGLTQTVAGKSVKVAGQNALVTKLGALSAYGNGQKEIDMLLTIARPEELFYVVFIAPESEWSRVQKTFDDVVASLKFTK
jgi:Zn-dependent protease with chaperone function